MNKSGDDAAAALLLLGVTLFLCITVLALGIVFIVLVALLFLGWVLTYWLLRAINEGLTDNWVTESEGLLALVIPALLLAGLAWWFFPPEWVWAVAVAFGWPLGKTWLYLVVGAGLLGLGFGFLSLFMLESKDGEGKPTLNKAGMLSGPEGAEEPDWNEENWDLLSEGVLLGDDF